MRGVESNQCRGALFWIRAPIYRTVTWRESLGGDRVDIPGSVKEIAEYALRLEKDGMRFYQERANSASDDYEKSLFESLIKDEAKHIKVLETVFADGGIRDANALLSQLKAEDPKKVIKTIFTEASEEKGGRDPAAAEALDAFDLALEMEKKGYTFYKEASQRVQSNEMASLLNALAEMEKSHIEVVTESKLYLERPERWFFENEPWILD